MPAFSVDWRSSSGLRRPLHRLSARSMVCAVTAALALAPLLAGCSSGGSGSGGSGSASSQATVTVTEQGVSPAPASSQPAPASQSPAAVAERTITDPQADISVEDQVGGGRSVRVEDVQISNGTGHIAIYSAGGRLLGSRNVGPLVRRTTVSLSRPVPRTSELLAVLYGDDGDGTFERSDPRVVDEEGDFRDDTFDYRLLR